jgi:hypothetical protein
MRPSDRVDRLQSQQPTGATILEVRWDNALIEYDEGGQGWWPLSCLQLSTTADWARFKKIALNSDTLNQIIAAAYESAPVAAGALASALLRAESGDVSDFADAWKKITRAVQVPAEVTTGFVGVAQACQLPADFVAALSPN